MGRKWNLMGENGKGNGGYVNLPFLRKMKIFGFALGHIGFLKTRFRENEMLQKVWRFYSYTDYSKLIPSNKGNDFVISQKRGQIWENPQKHSHFWENPQNWFSQRDGVQKYIF